MSGIGTSGILTSTLSCTTYYETVEGNAFAWGAPVTLSCEGITGTFPTYYVTNREVEGKITRWTCSDGAYKTDADVEFADADFADDKISAVSAVNKACSACGFSGAWYAGGSLSMMNTIGSVERSLIEGKSAREIFELFATAMCGYWFFEEHTEDGQPSEITFCPFGVMHHASAVTNHSKIPTGSCKTYAQVIMQDGEEVYSSGSGSARQTLSISTPLASQTLCSAVGENVNGFTYEAWSCKGLTDMVLTPGHLMIDGEDRWCTNVTLHPTASGLFFSASANPISENEYDYTVQVQRQLKQKAEWEKKNGSTALSKDGLKIFMDENSGKRHVISVYKKE